LNTLSLSELKKAFENQDQDFFEKILSKTKFSDKEIEALRCERDGLPLTPEMQEILTNLNSDYCSGCKPLVKPSCDDKKCTCSKICLDWCQRVCPDSSLILKQLKTLSIPFKENLFEIPNLRNDFGIDDRADAYLYGILGLKKKIAALSKFKPNEKPKDKDGLIITDEEKLSEYFSEILEEINRGKVTTIPSFSSINDFISSPAVSAHLKTLIKSNISAFDLHPDRLKSDLVMKSDLTDLSKTLASDGSAIGILADEDGKKKIFDFYHLIQEKKGDETWFFGCHAEIFPNKEDYLARTSWRKKGSSNDIF